LSNHIPSGELSALVLGVLPSERRRAVLLHLLKCPMCVNSLRLFIEQEMEPVAQQEDIYDEAINQAFQRIREDAQQLKADRARIQTLVEMLEQGGLENLPALVRKGWEIPVVEALLERSWALRHDAPAQMVELAEFAQIGMRRVKTEDHGATRVADLRCRVWTELGNAYRIADRLDDSEEAFGRAVECYLQGTQDKLLLARFLDFRASLYRSKRELTAASKYLHLACRIYRRYGQKHMEGRALIGAAIAIGYAGEPERAIRYIQRGLSLIGQDEDQELMAAAVHNRLWFTVDCGRFEEARRLLFLNRSLYKDAGRLSRLKLEWLEARLDTGLGNLARAEAGFQKVRAEFEQAGLPYDSALATLDLAAVVLRSHGMEEANELVLGAAEAFIQLGLQRQALAAVLFLRESFDLQVATLVLLEEVTAFLRRAQHDRYARFAPSAV
jgi:tetratricopeptide (TPR) repeat protein